MKQESNDRGLQRSSFYMSAQMLNKMGSD